MTAELATETRRTGFVIPADADIMRITQAELDANEEFYEVPGFGLVSDKMTAVGLPFSIIGLTFHVPVKDKANDFGERDYVTCRSIVHDEDRLTEAVQRGWIPSGKPAYDPGERIVINDGSTGIRRQLVQMLHSWGLINVGTIEKTSDWDKPWTQWDSFSDSIMEGETMVPNFDKNHNGNRFVVKVRRGLRVSEYTNDYGDGVTFYL
jgi:hypothetical protein